MECLTCWLRAPQRLQVHQVSGRARVRGRVKGRNEDAGQCCESSGKSEQRPREATIETSRADSVDGVAVSAGEPAGVWPGNAGFAAGRSKRSRSLIAPVLALSGLPESF